MLGKLQRLAKFYKTTQLFLKERRRFWVRVPIPLFSSQQQRHEGEVDREDDGVVGQDEGDNGETWQ